MEKEKCFICGSVRHRSHLVAMDGKIVHDYHTGVESDDQWYNRIENEINLKG